MKYKKHLEALRNRQKSPKIAKNHQKSPKIAFRGFPRTQRVSAKKYKKHLEALRNLQKSPKIAKHRQKSPKIAKNRFSRIPENPTRQREEIQETSRSPNIYVCAYMKYKKHLEALRNRQKSPKIAKNRQKSLFPDSNVKAKKVKKTSGASSHPRCSNLLTRESNPGPLGRNPGP